MEETVTVNSAAGSHFRTGLLLVGHHLHLAGLLKGLVDSDTGRQDGSWAVKAAVSLDG